MSKKLSNLATLEVLNSEEVKGGRFVRYSFTYQLKNFVCKNCKEDNSDK